MFFKTKKNFKYIIQVTPFKYRSSLEIISVGLFNEYLQFKTNI
jgi:hypothetical protein